MTTANPAPTPLSTPRTEDRARDPWLAEDPWLTEDPLPPPWLASDPAPHDPEDVSAWLDRELERAAPWLIADPWLDDDPGPVAPVEVLKAGRWDRSCGDGGGFAAGGVADHLLPGPVLAGLAGDRWAQGLGNLTDDELIGVLRAGRRLASWAAAMELAAVSDLWRRRTAEQDAGDTGAAFHADAEVAAALALTRRAADTLLALAAALDRLPLTRAALAAADIDLPRAMVIADEVTGLSDAHAAAVEAAVLAAAPAQTTGQLRAATRRAVLAADPGAARQRKEEALREARVERWAEPAGTAALAGRDLPPAEVLAADANLTALAKQLKAAGTEGTLDALRARIYLALLTGTPATALLPTHPSNGPNTDRRGTPDGDQCGGPDGGRGGSGDGGRGGGSGGGRCGRRRGEAGEGCPGRPGDGAAAGPAPAMRGSFGSGISPGGLLGLGGAGVAGKVNLTLPLATWLGQGDAPGHAAGFGPLDAIDARALTSALAAHAGTQWCLTLTGPDGRPLAHGCARTGPPHTPHDQPRTRDRPGTRPRDEPGTQARARPGTGGRGRPGSRACDGNWTFTLTPLDGGECDHAWETPAYQPPALLRHLVNLRHANCVFPGCRRPAAQCDADHTVAYERGGRTCLCNLAPLCRHHHQVKQTPGWALDHTTPGGLTWTTPSGRRYMVTPSRYPP